MLQHLSAPGTVHYSVETICVLKWWPWTAVYTLNIFCFIYLLHFCLLYGLIACTVVIALLLVLLQGVNVDFPPNKLKQGFGEHAVFVLDHLADAALKSTNFTWKK